MQEVLRLAPAREPAGTPTNLASIAGWLCRAAAVHLWREIRINAQKKWLADLSLCGMRSDLNYPIFERQSSPTFGASVSRCNDAACGAGCAAIRF